MSTQTVYAVFRQAIYRHDCLGIFTSQEAAKLATELVVSLGDDGWHSYEIIPFPLGESLPAKAARHLTYCYMPEITEPDPIAIFSSKDCGKTWSWK